MHRALSETVCMGISTNIPFHLRVLAEPDFVAGNFDTHYIDSHPALVEPHALSDEESAAAAAAAAVAAAAALSRGTRSGNDPVGQISAWSRAVSWRA